MRMAQHSIWIARPREAVFDFFIDFSQASRWRQYVASMTVVDGMPLHVGSRLRVEMDVMGAHQTFDMEVLALERPSIWRHRTFESDFKGHVEYRFDTEGEGTRVTFTIVARPQTMYGWLALPIMALSRRKPYAMQLPHLKRVLEEEDAAHVV
jgi:uncharacterized protein YndB with AHSA1/START domain